MSDLMNAAAKKECCSGILHSTQSICPICHKAVEAFYIEEDNKVYFIKYFVLSVIYQLTIVL